MALLSDNARQAIENNKHLLRKDDIKGFYSNVPGTLKGELSKFFIDCGVNIFKYIDKIPRGMFYNSKITDITIPENIEVIGPQAFKDCIELKSVTIEPGVEVISDRAFSNCAELSSVDLGRVTAIKSGAFEGCNKLKEVYLPDSVTIMGNDVWPKDNEIIIHTPPRKKRSLRFPKGEMEWYKARLVVDRPVQADPVADDGEE